MTILSILEVQFFQAHFGLGITRKQGLTTLSG